MCVSLSGTPEVLQLPRTLGKQTSCLSLSFMCGIPSSPTSLYTPNRSADALIVEFPLTLLREQLTSTTFLFFLHILLNGEMRSALSLGFFASWCGHSNVEALLPATRTYATHISTCSENNGYARTTCGLFAGNAHLPAIQKKQ